jgi:hypothetical protein
MILYLTRVSETVVFQKTQFFYDSQDGSAGLGERAMTSWGSNKSSFISKQELFHQNAFSLMHNQS